MTQSKRIIVYILGIVLLVAVVVGIVKHNQKPQAIVPVPPTPVQVAPVTTGAIEQTTSVTGSLSTLNQTDLSAKIAGRVTYVAVHEGDAVKAGEVIIQLDPSEVQATVNQDQANVQDALAKLAQAKIQYTQSITNANVAVENAKSVLAAAKATLAKTIEGQQIQQKEQAKDQYLQQQANYQNAETSYNREKQLFDEGAAAKQDLDNAQTQFNVQKALLDSYKQAMDMALAGGRSQDIQAAQETVQQDQLGVTNAVANLANEKVNRDAIIAAQATVAQDQATLAGAQTQLSEMTIYSPIDGFVSSRATDPGQIANPGTALMTLVDLHTVYYEPTISDVGIGAIHAGQPVNVAVDSFPNQKFMGEVAAVLPSASPTNPAFSIRVSIPNPNLILKPGMFARGTIITKVDRNAVVIPLSAMVPRDQTNSYSLSLNSTGTATGQLGMAPQKVFLFNHGKAVARNVEIGIIQDQRVEITSGLEPGDRLIVMGQTTIQDGDPVAIPGAKGKKSTAPSA